MTKTTTVRIPTPLRKYTGGSAEVAASGATVGDALTELRERHGELGRMLFTEDGALRPFVNVFAGEHNIKTAQGLATPIPEGTVISILPAVAGGSA